MDTPEINLIDPIDPIDVEMEQLRLARVDETYVRSELESVEEEQATFLQSTAQGRHIASKLSNLTDAKELVKTITKTRYDAVRDSVLVLAKVALAKGGSPWGRGIHVNADVQKGSELQIIDIGKAVTWLQTVGKGEIVSIPLRKNTGFFKNSVLPEDALKLLVIPTVKIDKEIVATSVVSEIPPALPTGLMAAVIMKKAISSNKHPVLVPITKTEPEKTDEVRSTLGGGKSRRV